MKKLMTRLLSLVLLGAFIPSFALAQEWDLNNGNIIVNAVPGTEQTVSQAGSTPTVDNNPVITSSSGKTNNTVTITAEKNATANVTLENVNIDTGTTGGAAITTSGEGNVNIELNGTNTVQSGNTHACPPLSARTWGPETFPGQKKALSSAASPAWQRRS